VTNIRDIIKDDASTGVEDILVKNREIFFKRATTPLYWFIGSHSIFFSWQYAEKAYFPEIRYPLNKT